MKRDPTFYWKHSGKLMSFANHPIKIILPFGPPGFSSRVGFALQPHLSEFLQTEVTFEHIIGGFGGSNGPTAAAKCAPDGCSLLLATIGNIALLPNIFPDYAIDPIKSFETITKIATTPNILVARPGLGVTSLHDILKIAKERPGKLKFHGINERSIHMLEFKSLIAETDIQLHSIKPDGGSEGAIDAIKTGKVDLTITTGPRLLEGTRSEDFIAIASISDQRTPFYPEIPTMKELGLNTIGSGSWTGLFAPKGVSNKILEEIFEATINASQKSSVIQQLSEQAASIDLNKSLEDALNFVKNETERLRKACIVSNFF
jgi:tripartite-type tricarboxylate transporter receptor subunit TctC